MKRDHQKLRILLIDDDVNLSKVLAHQLKKQHAQVYVANSGKEGLQLFRENDVDVVLTDIQMPDLSGLEVLHEIRKTDKQVVVIMITAYGSIEGALEACRLGADDYITKPFGQEQLTFLIEKNVRLRRLQQENVELRHQLAERYSFANLVAESSAMKEVLRVAMQVAHSDATVLIQGESGTGKEIIAKAIHLNSPRKDKPFVVVNCPSIPENLLESELFGHVRGAFTGAVKDRVGKFQLANGGTLFLDEIGDLRLELQAKLLRVLQEREIERVGDSRPIPVDVRIIAATNRDLLELVREGRFREDLYYRLSVVPITLPPLRERKEEIPYLVDFFLRRFAPDRRFEIDPEFIRLLENYPWPGNVRELENVIERAVVLSTEDRLTAASLPPHILASVPPAREAEEGEAGHVSLEEVERRTIEAALEKAQGNKSRAARLLKIPRHVLLYRMKKLGLQ